MSEQTQTGTTGTAEQGADAGAQTTATTTQQDATTTTATAAGTQTAGTQAAQTFTQADVDRIVQERLQRAEAKAKEAAEKAARDAEAKALAEQGKFKELYEQAQAQAAAHEAELQKARLENMRQRVATKVGLPSVLVDRLAGDTEEAIEADAKALLAALPKPAAPNINSGTGDGGAPQAGVMTEAEKMQLAAIYGVNPKFIQ